MEGMSFTPEEEAEYIEQQAMRTTVWGYRPLRDPQQETKQEREREAQAFVEACQAQRRPRSEAERALRGVAKRAVERREAAMRLHPSSGLLD